MSSRHLRPVPIDPLPPGVFQILLALFDREPLGIDRRSAPPADADSDDSRRRYYRATTFGGAVAEAEAQRFRQLHRTSSASGVLSATGTRGRA